MSRRMDVGKVWAVFCGLLACLMSGSVAVYAQHSDTLVLKPVHQIGMDIRPAYVFPTNNFFDGENNHGKTINQSLAIHLKYSFRFGRDSHWGKLYPYAYQGIGVAYNTFYCSSEMGTPVTLYTFQGSRIKRLSSRLSLDYEWNFGASFGWKKYNSVDNWENDVVGSKINAYLNLAFLLNWRLDHRWHVIVGVDLTHYSNGNTHYPNDGVNLVGARVGVVRTFGNVDEKAAVKTADDYELFAFKPYVSYDLVVYGATRKKGIDQEGASYLVPGSFGVVGLNFNPMYNFNKHFKAGVSLDAQFDESANIEDYQVEGNNSSSAKFHRPPFRKQFAVGLSLRGELVMPIFSVNVGIGHNVIYSGNAAEGLYQILALKTSITKQFFLHVGYQVSKFKNPNNLMLGVGYRFNAK